MDGVEVRVREVDEALLGRVRRRGERVDPRPEQALLTAQRSHQHPGGEGRRPRDEVSVGDVAVVTRRQEEVLAPVSLVASGDAHVGDVALPQVVDEAQRVLRHLDHGGSVLVERQVGHPVRRLRVRREHQRRRTAARGGEADGAGVDAEAGEAAPHGHHRGAGHTVEEHLDPAQQVQRVVAAGDRVGQGEAVEEVQRAEDRLHPVRDADRGQSLGGRAGAYAVAHSGHGVPPDRINRINRINRTVP